MLHKIQGHTYYYPAPTNVGVVRFKSGMALLVDAGIDSGAGRALAQALDGEGIKPKYIILTHAHPDHYGAVKWLKEQYTGLIRYAREETGILMAHPDMESRGFYGATPLRELEGRFIKGPQVEIDMTLSSGQIDIGDQHFDIVPLPGHTHSQIGVLTADGVLFAGDSLFSEEIMEKYPFPFLLDVEAQLQTIERIASMDMKYVVLSHAPMVYTSIKGLCQQNKARIEHFIGEILEWCNQPLTREDITEQVITATEMDVDIPRYYMTYATVGAFLSYLANRKELEKSIISGKLYFYRE